MEFEGHALYKIGKSWVFDLTTFIGYHVSVDDSDKVESYQKAFMVIYNNSIGSYSFDKYTTVPTRVLRRVVDVIQKYRKEALLEDGR